MESPSEIPCSGKSNCQHSIATHASHMTTQDDEKDKKGQPEESPNNVSPHLSQSIVGLFFGRCPSSPGGPCLAPDITSGSKSIEAS